MPDFFQWMLERLTDNYAKRPDSNIGKLLRLIAGELEEIKATLLKIEEWRDVDKAEGQPLNRIGYNVQQYRGLASDEIYRVLIKSRIARNRSDGSIDTIIRVLSLALDVDPSEIHIAEAYNDPYEPEPAAIKVMELPIEKILSIGMTGEQFGRMVAKTVAGGVGVQEIEMYGTFQFSSLPDQLEHDPETGFADVEMTTGGTLGMIYRPSTDIEFPLD